MKKFFTVVVLATAAVMAVSCGGEKDPIQTAVVEKIMNANPDLESIEFTKFEKVNDVTLAEELNRRESLFRTKEKTYAKRAVTYGEKKMVANAEKNKKKHQETLEILERIVSYREAHSAQMDSVIYSVYTYDCFGKMKDGNDMEADGMFATVSPEGLVYTIRSAGTNPSSGMGLAIPDYFTEILGRNSETEGE